MSGRDEIVEQLERTLIGPGLGEPDPEHGFEREVIRGRLSLAYMMGMLYPRAAQEEPDAGGDEDEAPDADIGDTPDDPLSMASALLPASMGLSACFSAGATIRITANAAVYEEARIEGDPDQRWKRRPLPTATVEISASEGGRRDIFEGRAVIDVLSRQLASGDHLVTISISNATITEGRRRPDISRALFQVDLRASAASGNILQYPAASYVPPTDEERELRLIYGAQRPYAAGHGVAADWGFEGGKCSYVKTEPLPRAHVWRPVFDRLECSVDGERRVFEDRDLFLLCRLGDDRLDRDDLIRRLTKLVDFYELWIRSLPVQNVDAAFADDAKRIVGRCSTSADRMREGIRALQKHDWVFRAFVLSNRALLMSMSHAARVSGRDRKDGKQGPFELGEADTSPIAYLENTGPAWRPFQLAFMLQVLPSLVNPRHNDRSIVDVIWFATGGGKTEAYLLLAAFELIRRRMALGPAGVGTGVINRYTYRFLTADQFQRTAGMICALEALRRQLQAEGDLSLGTQEFSVGLFVGADSSPNRYASLGEDKGALELYNELIDSKSPRSENPFPIENCPSCGTLLVPEHSRRMPDGSPDTSYYGFSATANSFRIRCTDEGCSFHGHLPIYIVDDQLYATPPSFLLGTVDKFAMVPWGDQAGRLFGAGATSAPPSLIIQDELHLISGPLGTLAGIYEAAFETLIKAIGGDPPKVIASTATIRNAAAQCRRIYGRPSAVFPAPGLSADDSFFSSLDVGNRERSRLYIGVMGQGLRSTVAVSWTVAAAMQAVHELDLDNRLSSAELDSYWTLVAYHNSKRELGRIANATRDEIPTRLKVYSRAEDCERSTNFRVLELKAHSEVPVPQARQILGKKHTQQEPAVDIVPCTNIISVGVDIDRLGFMLVNGQPKLTAEYIQATSRVGRGEVPGLVLTCFSPSKPRDRSHYEAFRDFHEKFYSFVEPTSVTPGAIPAIERALHAALVTVVRHAVPGFKTSPRNFNPNAPPVAAVVDALLQRLWAAYPEVDAQEERTRLDVKLGERVQEWASWSRSEPRLQYRLPKDQTIPGLLLRFGEKARNGVGWITLQSMRHVDTELVLEG